MATSSPDRTAVTLVSPPGQSTARTHSSSREGRGAEEGRGGEGRRGQGGGGWCGSNFSGL